MTGPVLMRAKSPIVGGGKHPMPTNKKCQTCGSRCYNARNDVENCVCPCGGINHGVGLAQALINAKAMKDANADVIFSEKGMNEALDLIAKGLATVPEKKVAKRKMKLDFIPKVKTSESKPEETKEITEIVQEIVSEEKNPKGVVGDCPECPSSPDRKHSFEVGGRQYQFCSYCNTSKGDCVTEARPGNVHSDAIVMTPAMQAIAKKNGILRDAKGHFIKRS